VVRRQRPPIKSSQIRQQLVGGASRRPDHATCLALLQLTHSLHRHPSLRSRHAVLYAQLVASWRVGTLPGDAGTSIRHRVAAQWACSRGVASYLPRACAEDSHHLHAHCAELRMRAKSVRFRPCRHGQPGAHQRRLPWHEVPAASRFEPWVDAHARPPFAAIEPAACGRALSQAVAAATVGDTSHCQVRGEATGVQLLQRRRRHSTDRRIVGLERRGPQPGHLHGRIRRGRWRCQDAAPSPCRDRLYDQDAPGHRVPTEVRSHPREGAASGGLRGPDWLRGAHERPTRLRA